MNLITIGVPRFVLAMEPNKDRIKGTFLSMVIKRASPISFTVYTVIIVLLFVAEGLFMEDADISTISVLLTTIIMLIYQFKLCTPFNWIRRVMFISLCVLFSIEVLFFKDFFMLSALSVEYIFVTVLLLILGLLMWYFYNRMLVFLKKCVNKYIK